MALGNILCRIVCVNVVFVIAAIASLVLFYMFADAYRNQGRVVVQRRGHSDLKIVRDEFGVPYIFAKTRNDAAYGLGYVHAQDRLWSLAMRTLIMGGKLSECFGPSTVKVDKYLRTVGFARMARDNIMLMSKEAVDYLQAYSDGINDYAASLWIWPLEFYMTGCKWEPWTPERSLATAKAIGFLMSFDWPFELLRQRLVETVGVDLASELLPMRGEFVYANESVILSEDDLRRTGIYEKHKRLDLKEFVKKDGARHDTEVHFDAFRGRNGDRALPVLNDMINSFELRVLGSNNWAVHGNHTRSGRPLLAGDPHLDNSVPCTWYLASLIVEDEDTTVTGAWMPGMPIATQGRSSAFAWTVTTAYLDSTDLYQETLDETRSRFLFEGKWQPMTQVEETIKVKGEVDVIFTVNFTRHGPLLDSTVEEFHLGRGGSHTAGYFVERAYALAWTGFHSDDRSYEGFWGIVWGKNSKDLDRCRRDIIVPPLYLLWADTQDIGMTTIGRLPKRSNAERGSIIQDGTKQANDWLGFIPTEDTPWIVNPPRGFLISANNKLGDNIKHGISETQFSTPRALRIEQMLREAIDSKRKLSVEDMMRMQNDVKDAFVARVLPDFIFVLQSMVERHVPQLIPARARLDTLVGILRKFDAVFTIDSAGAAVYSAWEYAFRERLLALSFDIHDENRVAIADNIAFEQIIFRRMHKWAAALKENKDAKFKEIWCEAIATDLIEGMTFTEDDACGQLIALALVRAEEELARIFKGRNPTTYTWGEMHPCRMLHSPMSQTLLDAVFGMRYPCPGNTRTVNVAAHFMRNGNYEARHGPNYRSVVDLDEAGQSYFVTDTGQSENVFSKLYRNLNELHRVGRYVPMRSSTEVSRSDIAATVLQIQFEAPPKNFDEL